MPRKRPGRVRTKHDNGRPPLLLSTLKPHNISLREGETRTILCPDCETWRRLMGETQLKIRKHCAKDCTGCTSKAAADRTTHTASPGRRHTACPGTDQPVTLNISIEQWAERLLAADSTATGRRSARQHYKPIPAPAEPIARMSPVPKTKDDALTAYRTHLRTCRSSTKVGRCTGAYRCNDGTRLAALYKELSLTQPARDREARLTALRARRQASADWHQHTRATPKDKTGLAKRSGTSTEEANNNCRARTADTVSEFHGPELPTTKLRIRIRSTTVSQESS
ncbi:hypothetical protein [Streptomyces anulatus]|uniref:hypothetical protein n=1 Tax=Streptomyces anulatus TaxID=1892 RepID=UPI00342B6083